MSVHNDDPEVLAISRCPMILGGKHRQVLYLISRVMCGMIYQLGSQASIPGCIASLLHLFADLRVCRRRVETCLPACQPCHDACMPGWLQFRACLLHVQESWRRHSYCPLACVMVACTAGKQDISWYCPRNAWPPSFTCILEGVNGPRRIAIPGLQPCPPNPLAVQLSGKFHLMHDVKTCPL